MFSAHQVFLDFLAIVLAAVNIFGGFLVTQRMLQMYKKKKKIKNNDISEPFQQFFINFRNIIYSSFKRLVST